MEVNGKRVLIVEDEFLVALSLQDHLASLGCLVIGPVTTLAAAIQVAESETVDVAILDVNLRGEMVFAAADILVERGVPIIFCSGHLANAQFPERHSDHMRVPKPYTAGMIVAALKDVLAEVDEFDADQHSGSPPNMSA